MYQTLQCTGMAWCLHLMIRGQNSIRLAYSTSFNEVCRSIQPNIPVRVIPDHIFSKYFTLTGKGIVPKHDIIKTRQVRHAGKGRGRTL